MWSECRGTLLLPSKVGCASSRRASYVPALYDAWIDVPRLSYPPGVVDTCCFPFCVSFTRRFFSRAKSGAPHRTSLFYFFLSFRIDPIVSLLSPFVAVERALNP